MGAVTEKFSRRQIFFKVGDGGGDSIIEGVSVKDFNS